MLVIGCGNPERGDDGAGILVAQRLGELGLDACVYTSESLGLIDLWEHADNVILVDAVVTGAPAGTIHVWDGRRSSLTGKAPASTHGLGVAEAIGLARSLNRLPSRLRVYTIEGRCFDLGTNISHEIQDAADEVVRQILAKQGHPTTGKSRRVSSDAKMDTIMDTKGKSFQQNTETGELWQPDL